jgi:hypothetical protein
VQQFQTLVGDRQAPHEKQIGTVSTPNPQQQGLSSGFSTTSPQGDGYHKGKLCRMQQSYYPFQRWKHAASGSGTHASQRQAWKIDMRRNHKNPQHGNVSPSK